jgi:hypothetical protein
MDEHGSSTFGGCAYKAFHDAILVMGINTAQGSFLMLLIQDSLNFLEAKTLLSV